METSTAVLGLQSCTCSYQHSIRPYASRRDDSNFLAGTSEELVAAFSLKLTRRQVSALPLPTRCLYSPLVETSKAYRVEPVSPKRDGNGEESRPVRPSLDIGFIHPTSDSSSGKYIESSPRDSHLGNEKGYVQDSYVPAPQDPIAAAHGDASSFLVTATDAGYDLEARRSTRYQPQAMSLTHRFRTSGNQAVSCITGVAGHPVANASRLKGPAGLLMGIVVMVLGIATAVHKAAGMQPQKVCTRCDGYGYECCDVCDGLGRISWEGKVHRTIACPCCFGSHLKKCPRCDGYRAKKESPPVWQKLKMKTLPERK